MVMAIDWRLHRHHRGPQFLIDTTNTEWILLSGQNWIPPPGHQWVLFHGHGQGARNTALRELVSAMPAPLVAEMLGYSDKVTQKHVAEVGNTWAQYASGNDRTNTPRRGSRRAMPAPSQDRPNDDAEQSEARFDEGSLFDLDPPVRPYDIHLESLSAAATALSDARDAVQRADEQLAQVVLQARQAGLSWTKIATRLGTSRQAAYQRWSSRLPNIDQG